MSFKVIVNEHVAVVSEVSNAVHDTVVVPIPKKPGGGAIRLI